MFIHQWFHFDSDGVNNSNLSPLLFHRDLVTKLCDDVNSLGISGIYIGYSTSTFCLFHENYGEMKVQTKEVYHEFNCFAIDLDSASWLNF